MCSRPRANQKRLVAVMSRVPSSARVSPCAEPRFRCPRCHKGLAGLASNRCFFVGSRQTSGPPEPSQAVICKDFHRDGVGFRIIGPNIGAWRIEPVAREWMIPLKSREHDRRMRAEQIAIKCALSRPAPNSCKRPANCPSSDCRISALLGGRVYMTVAGVQPSR